MEQLPDLLDKTREAKNHCPKQQTHFYHSKPWYPVSRETSIFPIGTGTGRNGHIDSCGIHDLLNSFQWDVNLLHSLQRDATFNAWFYRLQYSAFFRNSMLIWTADHFSTFQCNWIGIDFLKSKSVFIASLVPRGPGANLIIAKTSSIIWNDFKRKPCISNM